MRKRTLLLAAAAAPALFASLARADSYNWTPTTAGPFNWTDPANWTGGGLGFPQLANDSATIQPGPAGAVNIALPIAVSIGNLTFGNSANPALIDIGNSNSGGGTLVFDNGGTFNLVSGGVAGANNLVSAPIALLNNLAFNPSSNPVVLSGPITNTNATHNFLNLSGQTLRITGPVALSQPGATAAFALSLNRDPNNSIVNFNDIEISGDISDGGFAGGGLSIGPVVTGLTPVTRSTITLSGNNTYSGFASINCANVVLGSDTALGTGHATLGGDKSRVSASLISNDDARTVSNGFTLSQFASVKGQHSLTLTGDIAQTNNRDFFNLLPAGKTLTLANVICSDDTAGVRPFIIDGPGRTVVVGNVLSTSGTAGWSGTSVLDKRGTGTAEVNGTAAVGTNSLNAARVRGGLLQFSQPLAYGAATGITVEAGGAVGLLTGSTDPAFINILAIGGGSGPSNSSTPLASYGALALAPGDANVNLDFASGNLSSTNTQNMGVGAVSAGVTYTGTITPFNSTYKLGGGGQLTLPNANQLTGANNVTLDNGGVTVVSGTNDYTGVTTIGGTYINPTQNLGELESGSSLLLSPATVRVNSTLSVNNLANGGANSSIGKSSNAAGNLVLNGGTLAYTGTGASTDRLFTIKPNGGVIDSSGSGPVNFSNTGAILSADAASRPVTIGSGSVTSVAIVPDISDLSVGMTISGATIPAGTTIVALFPPSYGNIGATSGNGPYQILMSQAGADGAADTFTFGNQNRTLTLSGTNSGANTISGVLGNSASGSLGVTKTGSGKWILSAATAYGGVTTVQGGTLELAAAAQAPVNTGAGADVQAGRLALDYSGASPVSTINAVVAAGKASNFTTGQIRNSTGAANRALGVFDTGTSVDVAPTLYGDANLDLKVNALDFNALASNFGGTGLWMRGDFNYDNAVDTNDFTLLSQNFGQSLAAPAPVLGTLVPEPASMGLLAGMMLLNVRRRRQKPAF